MERGSAGAILFMPKNMKIVRRDTLPLGATLRDRVIREGDRFLVKQISANFIGQGSADALLWSFLIISQATGGIRPTEHFCKVKSLRLDVTHTRDTCGVRRGLSVHLDTSVVPLSGSCAPATPVRHGSSFPN